ncbi:DUF4954 family protein [Viscerimonas tarda]
MKATYRNLTENEILILDNNNCSCENWGLVEVKEGFSPRFVKNSLFSGKIRLGVFDDYFELEGGMRKHSGIFRATIHNCVIGDNVLIENINGYIANYLIQANTYIEDCNTLVVDGYTSFGNGVKVSALDETGGRKVIIHDKLSSHFAYIYSLYKYKPELIARMEKLVTAYAGSVSAHKGYIGYNVCIKNAGYIRNVKIGDNCQIEDTARLENGSINSNLQAPVYIGSGVIAQDFIISSDAHIDDGVSLTRCFVGQACTLKHGFSATDSLFFSNCQGENGEACSLFAGPYTVTHHKSTLLIGAMFSFYNAGSGSNQSNHMYKSGPIHCGIVERGSKTASGSYIAWPGYIGPFSLVLGKHYAHIDSSLLPFSYLVEKEGSSYLIPAINLCTVGTMRDARKWARRDGRTDPSQLDFINFTLMNPFVVGKIIAGINTLTGLQNQQGRNAHTYKYNGCLISNSALHKGIKLYNTLVDKYIGEILIKQLKKDTEVEKSNDGAGIWLDISGLIAPETEVEKILAQIESEELADIDAVQEAFSALHQDYERYEWNWALKVIDDYYPIKEKDLRIILKKWKDASIHLDNLVCEDIKKEFSDELTVGFGIDGSPEDKQTDLQIVRGAYENNEFVKDLQQKISQYEQIYEEITKLL